MKGHFYSRQQFHFVLFEGQVRLRQFLGRALRLGQARGPGAAARSPSSSYKTTCQQVGWAVGRMGVGPKIHHRAQLRATELRLETLIKTQKFQLLKDRNKNKTGQQGNIYILLLCNYKSKKTFDKNVREFRCIFHIVSKYFQY